MLTSLSLLSRSKTLRLVRGFPAAFEFELKDYDVEIPDFSNISLLMQVRKYLESDEILAQFSTDDYLLSIELFDSGKFKLKIDGDVTRSLPERCVFDIIVVELSNEEFGPGLTSFLCKDWWIEVRDSSTRLENDDIMAYVNNVISLRANSGNAQSITTWTANENIEKYDPVYLSSETGVNVAKATEVSHMNRYIGLALTSAALGSQVEVKSLGLIEDSAFNFNVDKELWLAANGQITQDLTTQSGMAFQQKIGNVISRNIIHIGLYDPILLS